MDQITIEHDGQTLNVPVSAVKLPEGAGFYGATFGDPEGYTPSARFNEEVERRVTGKLSNNSEYVKKADTGTDEFFKGLAKARGITLDANLKPVTQIDAETLGGYKRTWAEEELKPVATENETLRSENETLRRGNVKATTQAVLLSEFKPEAFKPAVPGTPSVFDLVVDRFVQFQDGKPVFVGEGGMPDPDVPAAILKYVGKHAKDLLADKRQHGGGLDGQPGGGGGKTMTTAEYMALMESNPTEASKRLTGGWTVQD